MTKLAERFPLRVSEGSIGDIQDATGKHILLLMPTSEAFGAKNAEISFEEGAFNTQVEAEEFRDFLITAINHFVEAHGLPYEDAAA